jgi:hypothetical protein
LTFINRVISMRICKEKCYNPVCVHRHEHEEIASCSYFKCNGVNRDCDNLIKSKRLQIERVSNDFNADSLGQTE